MHTMADSRKFTKVVVVGGGGTIGSSTALHLIRSGYTPSNITVLDTYHFPSAQSAGNDLNKIMGIRVRNKATLQLSLEARDMWRNDELFQPFFHNTGRVCRNCMHSDALLHMVAYQIPQLDCEVSEKGIAGLRQEYQALIDAGVGDTHEWLDSEDKILAKVPLLPRENIKVKIHSVKVSAECQHC